VESARRYHVAVMVSLSDFEDRSKSAQRRLEQLKEGL